VHCRPPLPRAVAPHCHRCSSHAVATVALSLQQPHRSNNSTIAATAAPQQQQHHCYNSRAATIVKVLATMPAATAPQCHCCSNSTRNNSVRNNSNIATTPAITAS